MKFIASVYRKRKCPRCDEMEAGLYERIDHGCIFSVEVGEYDTKGKARLAAMGAARAKGRGRHAGVCTGDWDVETVQDGCIEAGRIER